MHNATQIIGNLGRDPVVREHNGNKVANMNVATNRRYTNGNGDQVTETVWFQVSVWGGAAEACGKYLSKGSRIFAEGRITTPKVFEREDGTNGASLDLNARTVRFLDPRPDNVETEYQSDEDIDAE